MYKRQVQGIAEFYKAPLFSFHIIDISIGVIAALLIKCAVYVRGKNAKKYRNGIEYGSARWGTASDIAPYIDGQNFYNNVLLTNTERLTIDVYKRQLLHLESKSRYVRR